MAVIVATMSKREDAPPGMVEPDSGPEAGVPDIAMVE